MSDRPSALTQSSPIEGEKPIDGVTYIDNSAVFHVLATDEAATVGSALKAAFGESDGVVRPAGPRQWFVVPTSDDQSTRLAEMAASDQFDIGVVDQSHGRTRIRLTGAAQRQVLQNLVPIDLSLDQFPPGASAAVSIGSTNGLLTHISEGTYEILVLRSYAKCLWHALSQSAKSVQTH